MSMVLLVLLLTQSNMPCGSAKLAKENIQQVFRIEMRVMTAALTVRIKSLWRGSIRLSI